MKEGGGGGRSDEEEDDEGLLQTPFSIRFLPFLPPRSLALPAAVLRPGTPAVSPPSLPPSARSAKTFSHSEAVESLLAASPITKNRHHSKNERTNEQTHQQFGAQFALGRTN